jgi:hypothetical protein
MSSSREIMGKAKNTIVLEVLDKLRGQEVAITMGAGIWTGKITALDDHFMTLEDADGISLRNG